MARYSKNYIDVVTNMNNVLNSDKYSIDEKLHFLNNMQNTISKTGLKGSYSYNKISENLNNLMNNKSYTIDEKLRYLDELSNNLVGAKSVGDVYKNTPTIENTYYDQFKVKNRRYNPLLGGAYNTEKEEFEYDSSIKNGNKYTTTILNNGGKVPVPDEYEKPTGLNKLKKAVVNILGALASPFNAMNKGIQNAVDDDSKTSVIEGIKEGFKDSFGEPKFTSINDILETLRTSNSETKRGIGNDISRIGSPLVMLYNKARGKEQTRDELLNSSQAVTGFIGDLLEPSPLSFIKGVGTGAKLVSKGSKALNVADDIGGLSKAMEVVKKINPNATQKDAEFLLNHTTKILGGIDNYKGIRVGTNKHNLTIMKPETIAKIGDKTIASPLNKIRELMENSSIKQTLNKGFINKYENVARANPEVALETMALKNSVAKRINKSNINKEIIKQNKEKFDKIFKKYKNGEELKHNTDIIEKASKPTFTRTQIEELVDNPKFAIELNNERRRRLVNAEKEMKQLQSELVRAKTNGQAQNMKHLEDRIAQLNKELEVYNDVDLFKEYFIQSYDNIPYDDLVNGRFVLNNTNSADDVAQRVAVDSVKPKTSKTDIDTTKPNPLDESTLGKVDNELIDKGTDLNKSINKETQNLTNKDLNSIPEPDLSNVQINEELSNLLPKQDTTPLEQIAKNASKINSKTDNIVNKVNTLDNNKSVLDELLNANKSVSDESKEFGKQLSIKIPKTRLMAPDNRERIKIEIEKLIEERESYLEIINNKKIPDEIKKVYQSAINDIDKNIKIYSDYLANKPKESIGQNWEIYNGEQLSMLPRESNIKIDDIQETPIQPTEPININDVGKNAQIDNVTIGKPNVLSQLDKQIIMKELEDLKSRSKKLQDISLTKPLNAMSREDYNKELSRIFEMKRIYDNAEGTDIAKSRRVKEWLEDEAYKTKQEQRAKNAIQFGRLGSEEQRNALFKIKQEADEIEESFRKAGLLDETDFRKKEYDDDFLERLNINNELYKNEPPTLKELNKLEIYAKNLKGIDDAWANDVIKNIKEGKYKTREQVINATNSIKYMLKQVPIDESVAEKRLLQIFNDGDFDSFALAKKNKARVAKGQTRLNHYNYNGIDLLIDSKVPKTKVNRMFKALEDMPEQGKELLRNADSLSLLHSYLDENSDNVGKLFYKHKNIIISDKTNKEFYQHIVQHELGHLRFDNMEDVTKAFDSIYSEMKSLSKEQMREFRSELKRLGYNPSAKQARYLTSYAEKSANNGNIKEQVAEFMGLMLNSNPKVRELIDKYLPSNKALFSKMIDEMPKVKKILKEPKYNELVKKLEFFKLAKESVENNGDMKKLIAKYDELYNAQTAKELKEAMPDYIPKESEFLVRTRTKYIQNPSDLSRDIVEKDVREIFEFIMSENKRYAKEEDIQGITDYLMHTLSSDLKGTRKGKKVIKKVFGDDKNIIKEPDNIFSLQRKYKGTIKQINEHFKKKYGIDNFFETDVTKIYLERGIKHEDIMLKKNMFNDYMNLFSQQIGKKAIEGMNPAEKVAFMADVKSKLNSGKYTIIQKNSHYKDAILRTIDTDEIAKGVKQRNLARDIQRKVYKQAKGTADIDLGDLKVQINEPFIHIDPKSIKLEDVFLKNDEYYIVPTDSFNLYKNVAENQFKKQTNGLLKMYDKFTNLWKSQAILSGSFHVNNAIGNAFNSYLSVGADILNPKLNAVAIAIQSGKKTGKYLGKTYDDWAKIMKEYGVIGEGFFDKEVNAILKGSKTSAKATSVVKRLNPLDSQNFFLYSANRKVGGHIEDQARIVNFLSHVKNGKSYDEAAELVNKFLFDYSDLTDFEADVMKRIMPFYTFLRKNTPLQLEQIFQQPDKYGKIAMGIDNFRKEETEEQKMYRPEYLEDAIHIGNGKYKKLNLPINDLSKFTKPNELMSSMNPIVKYILERSTNHDLYYNDSIYDNQFEKDKKLKEHAKRTFIPIANRTGAIPSALEGDENAKQKLLGWLTGNRTYTVDVNKQKEYAKYAYTKKLKEYVDLMYKQGKIKSKYDNPLLK